jgi:hypothetical protein
MSKKLVITGIGTQVATTAVSYDKIPEHRHGWFGYDATQDDDGKTVSVTFKPVLLVDKDYSKDQLKPIIEHERHHERDFQRLAGQFKTAVTAAFKKDDSIDFGPWLDWLKFDVNEAAIAFHHRIDEIDLTQNYKPKSPRPK